MYCDPLLKLNKFRYVKLPKPKDYVARFGLHDFNGQYSGDKSFSTDNRKVSVLSGLVHDNEQMVQNEYSADLARQQAASQHAASGESV